ncbi:other 1 protein kinase [Favolaschia claudopus]|uniref:Other 1 protein kinase n=1 Tax=Favolaschia claudopus TaxID=2862362 RepID=A0AAW0ADL7_9AGAR
MSILRFSEGRSISSCSGSTTPDTSLEADTNLDTEPPWPLDCTTLLLSDGRSLELADSISQSNCANGQIVYTCRAKLDSCGVVVKWSWGPTRIYEAQILESAINLARERGDLWVLDHFPRGLHYEERVVNPSDQHSESRILHILVQEELYPITELTTAEGLGDAFFGVFKCYRWLYEAAGIMHRDIKLTTLMYHKLSFGEIYGVLDGFNLAVLTHAHLLHHRLETPPPLLAFDLLESALPAEYLYRYDLETLFFALLLIACHYEDGEQIAPPRQPFKDWHNLSNLNLLRYKIAFFTRGTRLWAPTSQFRDLRRLILSLRRMFRDGIMAQADFDDLEDPTAAFDFVTLGGHITFDTFENVLNTHLRPIRRRTPQVASSFINEVPVYSNFIQRLR